MKRMVVATLGILIFVFLLPMVQGFNQTCSNGIVHKTIGIDVNSEVTTVTITENCTYGCSDNGIECDILATDNLSFGILPLAIIFVALIFAYLATKMDKNWYQLLFVGSCMLFILLGMGTLGMFTTLTMSQTQGLMFTGFHMTLIIFGLFLLITLVLLIQYVFKPMFEKTVI